MTNEIKNKISTDCGCLFWNKERNRFEIEASEMRAAGCTPYGGSPFKYEVVVTNPKTGVSMTFLHDTRCDQIRDREGELLVEVFHCKEDVRLQLHMLND